MSFGYKTSWIAVRDRSVQAVADALGLDKQIELSFTDGTDRAYIEGVYVAAPIAGWTLAHGVGVLPDGMDATSYEFPDWLSQFSTKLGEVQFFATDRVTEYHAWAWASMGQVLRAYCYIGERGEVPLFLGEPTPVEINIGIGVRTLGSESESWTDVEWGQWYQSTPGEEDVMSIADAWSVNPRAINDDDVTDTGVYGVPVES